MQRTNLWLRPIDGKNLTSDWIEENFGENGWLMRPSSSTNNPSYLTYIEKVLVCVSWEYGKNLLSFYMVHDILGSDAFYKEQEKKVFDYLIGFFTNFEADENSEENRTDYRSAIRYNCESDHITFFFYWEDDESYGG